MKFSDAQNKAIDTRGDSLLVSAAAGSGKTAVLVERVIRRILSGGDISRMWIMTFTEAAAAEMQQKIEKAVEGRLEENPEDAHLASQLLAVPAANISTVHAACKRIIDQNFHQLGLDPATAIGDDSELAMLRERLLEEYVEQLYERADMAEFISFFSGGRSDEKLLGVLEDAYEYFEEQPFVSTEFPVEEDIFECFAEDALFRSIQDKMSEALLQYEANLTEIEMQGLLQTKMWQHLQRERDALRGALQLLSGRDFDAVGTAVRSITFANWVVKGKAYDGFEDQLTIAAVRRSYAKNLIVDLQKQVFHKSAAQHIKEIELTSQMLTTLFSAVRELDERFSALKRERSVMSFADLERFALQLLVSEYDAATDTLVPSETALVMREQIDEIIVDEYQDTNRMQDLIFRALSKEDKNAFMVGDVKQSIYRFRAACPELFLQKKDHSVPAGAGDTIETPSYLYLNQNYRSHPQILDFCNQIFRSSMSSRLGQIEYDESEQLNTGGLYPSDSQGHVELDIIIEEDDAEDELKLLEKEAILVAEKIRALHGTPFYDVKKQTHRSLKYGDMAILCRVANHVASYFEIALRRQGIDCINNNQDQQFLDMWEIKMLRSYLQVLSNPYRDIPLVTLMYSDFYCFTAADLASVRAENKYIPFYDALRLYAEKDKRCKQFLEEIEQLRRMSVGKRTDEVLQMIFTRTHILDKIAAYKDGGVRVANMQLMLRYAAEYEKDGYKGIFAFLNYLDKMAELKKILPGARGGSDPEDCVQILSVHKSKGLEYPVCFLVNLEKEFTNRESATMIHHNHLGCALKMREDHTFTEYTSLRFDFIKEANRRESLSEEMRILYVALTRPKTHLYLVCAEVHSDLEQLVTETAGYCGNHPAEFLSESPTALKWILYALRDQEDLLPLYQHFELPHVAIKRDCAFAVELYDTVESGKQSISIAQHKSVELEQAMQLALKKYSFAAQTKLPVKLSVSEVKGLRESDPEAMPLIPEHFGRRSPSFLSGKVSGNVVGNAVHKFMQFADFHALAAADGFAKEKERLLAGEYLTQQELSLVKEELIAAFVAQPIFKDMITADVLEKEKRFFFTMPAQHLFPDSKEQAPILLQGVLDCCYEKNGEFVIVDYKTDRLASPQQFAERYALQLKLYRHGIYKLTGKRADKLYLYSFHLNQVIEIS